MGREKSSSPRWSDNGSGDRKNHEGGKTSELGNGNENVRGLVRTTGDPRTHTGGGSIGIREYRRGPHLSNS